MTISLYNYTVFLYFGNYYHFSTLLAGDSMCSIFSLKTFFDMISFGYFFYSCPIDSSYYTSLLQWTCFLSVDLWEVLLLMVLDRSLPPRKDKMESIIFYCSNYVNYGLWSSYTSSSCRSIGRYNLSVLRFLIIYSISLLFRSTGCSSWG